LGLRTYTHGLREATQTTDDYGDYLVLTVPHPKKRNHQVSIEPGTVTDPSASRPLENIRRKLTVIGAKIVHGASLRLACNALYANQRVFCGESRLAVSAFGVAPMPQ